MNDLNSVNIIGRLTRDIDDSNFGYIGSGTAVLRLSIAVNRSRKGADGSWTDEASFFDVTVFGKTAENLKPYLTKGKQVAVEGYLKQDRWEKEGQKFSKVTIIANSLQLLGGRNESQQPQAEPFVADNLKPKTEPAAQQPVFDASFPEDIPF